MRRQSDASFSICSAVVAPSKYATMTTMRCAGVAFAAATKSILAGFLVSFCIYAAPLSHVDVLLKKLSFASVAAIQDVRPWILTRSKRKSTRRLQPRTSRPNHVNSRT
jgi:hypothetical protein